MIKLIKKESEDMKVSIIVPIYNAEKYLKKCINSILKQTYKELEIILINDGSTDKSKNIIESFHDKRIIFIDKTNTGVGNTRNLGIEKSSGDYIMFIDSDDFIETTCVEKMLNKALTDNCELVIGNYYLDTPNRTYNISFKKENDTTLKEKPEILLDINLGPCNKIYHKRLFKDTDNRFIVGLKYEDAPVVVNAIKDAKKIGYVDDYLFHYCIRTTGETITRDERIFDIITIISMIEKRLKEVKYPIFTDFAVKVLLPYLKNVRYITNNKLRNEFIDAVFIYLKRVDKEWYKCNYLKNENRIKKTILTHKRILKALYTFKRNYYSFLFLRNI